MNDPQFHQHGGLHPTHRPAWKRIHHSSFFWVAAAFILIAMVVYVASGNLAFLPGHAAQPAVPAIAP